MILHSTPLLADTASLAATRPMGRHHRGAAPSEGVERSDRPGSVVAATVTGAVVAAIVTGVVVAAIVTGVVVAAVATGVVVAAVAVTGVVVAAVVTGSGVVIAESSSLPS